MTDTPKTSPQVYMVVLGTVTDPAKMAVYAKALAESGLYERHDGHYLSVGKAVSDFENWPAGQSCVIATFPDQAAAESFWRSDIYQNEIKPLRDGAGDFQVGLFAATPNAPQ
jgi:uncharacterized protein (DUF1330 family)